jgi:hypothetical protein
MTKPYKNVVYDNNNDVVMMLVVLVSPIQRWVVWDNRVPTIVLRTHDYYGIAKREAAQKTIRPRGTRVESNHKNQ